MKSLSREFSRLYFHEVDKIATESSYKTWNLWKNHNNIFLNVPKIYDVCEIFVVYVTQFAKTRHN